MKVLLTATVQSHICQFHKPLVEMLHQRGYEVHVAAKNNLEEKNGLKLDFVDRVYNIPFSRSPKDISNVKAFIQLKQILEREEYDIIHCNTPMGGIVTRISARKCRKRGTKVFYTAHGFHFFKGADIKNWIVFYPIERFMSRFCDRVITITKEDYRLAAKVFHSDVRYMHGVGVDENRYHQSVDPMEKNDFYIRENIDPDSYTILCVGELNKNKNQKTLLNAVSILKQQIPELCVLLAGNGPLETELKERIDELHLNEHVKLLGYRTDLETITPFVDLIVSCSYREGMPLNIIEGMLCGKPVIASDNRGHRELIKNAVNGYLVDPNDAEEFANKIKELYFDSELSYLLGKHSLSVASKYTKNTVMKELEGIYFE